LIKVNENEGASSRRGRLRWQAEPLKVMPVTLKELTSALAGVGASVGLPVDQWIASDSATTHHQSLDPDAGLVETLYRQLSHSSSELWVTVFQKHLHGEARGIMKDVVAKLCLWKENFLPGKLEVTLQYLNYLRESVLDTICSIGEMFIQSKAHSVFGTFITCYSGFFKVVRGIPGIEKDSQAVSNLEELQAMLDQAKEKFQIRTA
jgi:hypothetical protein